MAGHRAKRGRPPQRVHRVDEQRKQFRERWGDARTPGTKLQVAADTFVAFTKDNQPDAKVNAETADELAETIAAAVRDVFKRRSAGAKSEVVAAAKPKSGN